MRRSNSWIWCVVLILVIFSLGISSANAQERAVKRTVGLAGLIQNGHPEILVPIWLGDRFVLAPAVALQYQENVGSVVGLGGVGRFYLYMERIAPYFGGQVSADITMPDGPGPNSTDLSIGVLFGGEFFLHQRFSVGVEAHGDFFLPDGGNNMFSTSTAVIANVYF
jgi:hypothetical protein